MCSKKEYQKGYRRHQLLELLQEQQEIIGSQMAKKFNVPRGTILSDIRALKAEGWPIQATSMVTEDGMYQAVYRLMQTPQR